MTPPTTTPVERVRHFLQRREFIAPHSNVVWSDAHCGAARLRYDDLRALLAQAEGRSAGASDPNGDANGRRQGDVAV